MPAKLDGTNGLLQQYDYQTPTTGFSYTFAAGVNVLVMQPAGTLATGTITMPAAPADGMTITFSSSQQITALTVQGNTGQSMSNAVTFLPGKTAASYVYRLSNTTWYPVQTVPGTGSQLVSGTSQASTSGTSIDFTGLPSWIKRITVMFSNVSTNGSANKLLQIGTSSGIQSTSYDSTCAIAGPTTSGTSSTAGYILWNSAASEALYGHAIITHMGSNLWVCSSTCRITTSYVQMGGGSVTLSGTLDRIRLTTTNGTDTFDAGSINILYE